ncbi:GIY-YIG nuclease family protein [Rhodopirellula baltica]|uniref:Membrane protein containing Putative helicase A859L domain n=1 Tax=Rhodopirellula baltica WH47 TaxID=991778 RepID=F2ARJ8_RHOBT|nr:GIY-YIG nuclease family protein [Rhodopirellula baltica]EGF27711.1 membrane protein containing Putative helicase A859L domain [Rhodopirellula baltica WH47]
MNEPSKVTRYCPECKAKITAEEHKFAKPQICPKCKTRVLFVDYVNVRPELPPDLVEFVDSGNPLAQPKVQLIATVAVVALAIGFLGAAFSGITIALFIAAAITFALGIAGVAYWLDHSTKANQLRQSYRSLLKTTEQLHRRQTSLVQHCHGFQTNFDQLVTSEKAAIQEHHAKLLADAAADRERAADAWSEVQVRVSEAMDEAKAEIDSYEAAASAIATKYLTEVRKGIKSKLNSNNYHKQLETYEKAVEFCGKKGYPVDPEVYESVKAELKEDYAEAVRKEVQRAEQARIREQIKEEQKAERELEREMKRIAAERKAIEKALAEALAQTQDEHSAEVEELRRRLREAESKGQRALSMAQQTKSGHVYVISNIGSFGDHVFKIGMSRRLDPMDRIKELGDASVPFPFDVHMMLESSNAPALENALHRAFHDRRVNGVNLRKEFFRVSIQEIIDVVESLQDDEQHTIPFTAGPYSIVPEADQYHATLAMTDEDRQMIDSTYASETHAANG